MFKKSLQELNLSNFFLFAAVMEEEELCKEIYIQKLHKRVKEIKKRDDLEVRYMYLYELMEEERKEGLTEGRRELSALVAVLLKAGDYVSLQRMTEDPLYQEELLRKYDLK